MPGVFFSLFGGCLQSTLKIWQSFWYLDLLLRYAMSCKHQTPSSPIKLLNGTKQLNFSRVATVPISTCITGKIILLEKIELGALSKLRLPR